MNFSHIVNLKTEMINSWLKLKIDWGEITDHTELYRFQMTLKNEFMIF